MVTDSGSCAIIGVSVSCDLGGLPHDNVIIVTVKAITFQAGPYENTATVTQREGDEVNPENNTDTIIFDVTERTTGLDLMTDLRPFNNNLGECPIAIEDEFAPFGAALGLSIRSAK